MLREPHHSLQPAAATHLRLYSYAAVVGLVQQAVEAFGSLEEVGERFPFLIGYVNQLAGYGLAGTDLDAAPQRWRELLREWQQQAGEVLPLRRLAQRCELDEGELVVLAGAALADDDLRFGAVFSALHGIEQEPRPTLAMLDRWADPGDAMPPRRAQRLLQLGLLLGGNSDAPLGAWCARLPPLLSQALRGQLPARPLAGLICQPASAARPLAQLVIDPQRGPELQQLQVLLQAGAIDTLLLRGPHGNGRRSLIAALAAACGQGLLLVDKTLDPALVPLIPALAALLPAVPLWLHGDAPPAAPGGWQAQLLDSRGGCRSFSGERCLLLDWPLPDQAGRARLWAQALPQLDAAQCADFAAWQRLGSGDIVRLAAAAATQAQLAGRASPQRQDVAKAAASLDLGVLATLAQRLAPTGATQQLVVADSTADELRVLQSRCRYREQLQSNDDHAGCGVRALLRGPSGTGKTLAARMLAGALQLPLLRVDLAAVSSKYVGETEKQLAQLFDRAEQLDVILLFDEGDALFGRRTALGSANDRYANLETNFLLQRIESHQGIMLLTTNLADNIDSAFQRRMDVVVDFTLPDADARRAIWALHLPAGHVIACDWLDHLAWRCSLSGGQIRNAAQHAALLALDAQRPLDRALLLAAVQREYRKAGAVCPLREGGGDG